jgi:hypothetical protein
MITIVATALINWQELWKIVLAALVGGTGAVIVFGVLLLGISRGKTATKPIARYGLYTLSSVCGVLIVAVAAFGVYAMTQKPSSGKPKPKAAATRLAPAQLAARGQWRSRLDKKPRLFRA